MGQMPDGATVAVTSGWDGGYADDLRIVESLEGFGWKGSFFVPPEAVGKPGHLQADDLGAILEAGHEVGLLVTDAAAAIIQLQALAQMVGGDVVSAAAARGLQMDSATRNALRAHGIRSLRNDFAGTIRAAEVRDWLELPYTASVLGEHMELRGHWGAIEESGDGLLYLVGESIACTRDEEDWATLECNLAYFCGLGHVWYCTQGEFAAAFSG